MDDINTSENTEISPGIRCGDFHGGMLSHTILPHIEEIVASCELWQTNGFTVTVIIRSIDNSNTTVGHLPIEIHEIRVN